MKDRRKVALMLVVAVMVALAGGLAYLVLVPSPSSPSTPSPHGSASCSSSGANQTAGNWTTYHQDNTRAGVESTPNITSVHPQNRSWTVDGQMYAEPLVCGDSIFLATEDDTIYAINVTSGDSFWTTHLGTPVPGSSLPCGDIDPSGITGTPVIDVATGTLYVVAFVTPGQHVLFGLNVANGSIRSQIAVDPAVANPLVEQQRGALALANGYVYVPYGGLDGDCGAYHGWVVGAPVTGSGGLISYQVPTHREGGIWSPAGIAVAANGTLYVATGNGDSTSSFDYGDSVIALSPSLTVLGYFAPSNWAQLNAGDTDLGSEAPTILPNGDVFQIGKAGVGYLLSGDHLGGIGGQVFDHGVCGGAYAGTAHVGLSILVPCVNGLFDVVADGTGFSVAWQTTGFDSGAPIVTGNVAWAVDIDSADLLGFNLTTGHQLFSFPLGSVDHFITPGAAPGVVFVGAGTHLYGFNLS